MNYDNYWKFISKCLCVCFLSEPKNKGNHAFFNLHRARKHIVTARNKRKKKNIISIWSRSRNSRSYYKYVILIMWHFLVYCVWSITAPFISTLSDNSSQNKLQWNHRFFSCKSPGKMVMGWGGGVKKIWCNINGSVCMTEKGKSG